MDFCSKIFGCSLRDLSYEKIALYFSTDQEETDIIEFKSFSDKGTIQDKVSGINKSVCAFANSEGGIIIWGAPEGKDVAGKKEKIFVGALTNIDQSIEKDALISRISSNIIPVPNGVVCKILEEGNNKICVFEVQQSEYAPHQFDNRYFMRLDGQSRPAPHHYIEALFKKIKYPNLEGYVKINGFDPAHDNESKRTIYRIRFSIYILNFSPLQNEELISWKLSCNTGMVTHYDRRSDRNPNLMNSYNFGNTKAKDVLRFGETIEFTDTFDIQPERLERENHETTFILEFGGRFSPLKISKYIVKLPTQLLPLYPNYFQQKNSFVLKDENKLASEILDEFGLNNRNKVTLKLLGIA